MLAESKSNCSSLPQLFPTAEARTSRMFSNDPTSTPATSKHSLSCKGGKSIWCGKGVKKKDYIECSRVHFISSAQLQLRCRADLLVRGEFWDGELHALDGGSKQQARAAASKCKQRLGELY
eukprot:1518311-Rhodomonas_salina.1